MTCPHNQMLQQQKFKPFDYQYHYSLQFFILDSTAGNRKSWINFCLKNNTAHSLYV